MTIHKVQHQELQKFVINLLRNQGVSGEEAEIIARHLVWNDMVGRYNHGTSRLPAYLKRLEQGLISSPCNPQFEVKSNAVTVIHGNDGFGQYLGHIGMTKAIEAADAHGIGLVGVNNSNHFGTGAYYVDLAAQQFKIGIALSNSFPRVAPQGGLSAVLGTNPFAFGVPTGEGKPVLIDFSTSSMSGSAVRKAAEESSEFPKGTCIDAEGNDIVDPFQASQGILLPFGGAKGFCMGLMVEILCGVLTGAAISHEIASLYKDFTRPSNVGHLFIAIDIASMIPMNDFYSRMQMLIDFIKAAIKRPDVAEILIPGEMRWQRFAKQEAEGVMLEKGTVVILSDLARTSDLPTPW